MRCVMVEDTENYFILCLPLCASFTRLNCFALAINCQKKCENIMPVLQASIANKAGA